MTASSVFATDINESVLEIARNKNYPKHNVKFQRQDLFSYKPVKKFESLFGGFILSHIKLQELDDFILKINYLVENNGKIVLIDNNYVEGSSHQITHKDDEGNTYQTRKLKDGSSHLVLKNFFSQDFILKKFKGTAEKTISENYRYYWIFSYKNKT